ncbi:winged helix DNA-binding domain-containing protein [Mycolicibacterium austroafricanum]|uniref:Winged helix DNA-binding domain-containing protein n=1 Tax=Mycolicibacterium austroafricanum TaxID=39687 RepID=A0ABT8HEN9_MYCAO|nr:winged helix DNA-binding domain-containing protein [Mycolicibacterium austroafricanum]MDN4518990.1 winged helix DNA-binding domain-containing protein [Mycolicibacterium austroafricanum]QRZ04505.1 AlkZ family DNA glycosylase [Mycolicibacterium austroafricanum]QZT66246.1 winged helix DNA-binding domain-containing protein [Mycolicibacterium austroafricanum]
MRSITIDERRARLTRRHHLAPGPDGAPSVHAVTGRLVGLHATDPATPHLSLWARLPGYTVADLNAALYERRSVVKQLAMRRTLWVIRAEDLPAVQSAAGDRVATNETRRLAADAQNAGVARDGHAWLEAACAAVVRHLRGAGPCTARELREALPELTGTYDPAPGKPYGGEGHLAPRVLTVLSARGLIVRGPNDGGWTTSRPRWAAAGSWLGPADPVSPDQARAELVRRWLHAFGPATVDDLKWWFGATLGWARQALSDVDAVEVAVEGSASTSGFVLPGDDGPEPDVEPWCALLPGLDVTTMGWAGRDWYLGPHRGAVFDRNGNAGPTVWVDGRVVGAWRQDDDGRVELVLLEDVGRPALRALTARAEELTAWLGGVQVKPRFPSPASKSAARR